MDKNLLDILEEKLKENGIEYEGMHEPDIVANAFNFVDVKDPFTIYGKIDDFEWHVTLKKKKYPDGEDYLAYFDNITHETTIYLNTDNIIRFIKTHEYRKGYYDAIVNIKVVLCRMENEHLDRIIFKTNKGAV